MRSYVSKVIEPEEYASLTTEELYEMIRDGLQVNEDVADAVFKSNRRAEYLERIMYVCPFCGFAEFESHGNEAVCKSCGRMIHYGEDKRISGVGFDFPFEFMSQWYDYQSEYVNSFDVTAHTQEPIFRDTVRLSEVILNKRKELLRKKCGVLLYGDRVVIDEESADPMVLPFEEIMAASVLGRNKLNIYHGDHVYQFKGGKRFNAVKYVNLYFRHKHIIRGEENGKFLGL